MTVDTTSFRALFSRSSQVEPKLRTALRRNIRNAAKGLADEVKAEAQAGQYQTNAGLRSRIASGVKVAILTGANREGVRITSSGLLAAGWQSPKGWRHPVFGGNKRVQQFGRPGYFYRTIGAGAPRVRTAVEQAMAEAVASMGGSA